MIPLSVWGLCNSAWKGGRYCFQNSKAQWGTESWLHKVLCMGQAGGEVPLQDITCVSVSL